MHCNLLGAVAGRKVAQGRHSPAMCSATFLAFGPARGVRHTRALCAWSRREAGFGDMQKQPTPKELVKKSSDTVSTKSGRDETHSHEFE
jgi:hypothetical protein